MKALPPSTSIHEIVEGVRLYRDDLERIIGILKESGQHVVIADSSFQYESLDDLQRARGNSPESLRIDGSRPDDYASVSLSRSGRFWHLDSGGKTVYGIAREIESILRRRQSKIQHLPLHWFLQVSMVAMGTGAAIRYRFQSTGAGLISVGATFFLVSALLSVHWLLHSGVVLKYPHEAGFIARNRDAIVLLILGALIGGVVQYLVGRLV